MSREHLECYLDEPTSRFNFNSRRLRCRVIEADYSTDSCRKQSWRIRSRYKSLDRRSTDAEWCIYFTRVAPAGFWETCRLNWRSPCLLGCPSLFEKLNDFGIDRYFRFVAIICSHRKDLCLRSSTRECRLAITLCLGLWVGSFGKKQLH